MRRWLVFLFAFVVGLGILFWVQARMDARRARDAAQREKQTQEPSGPEPVGKTPDELASTVKDKQGPLGQFEAHGAVRDRQLDPATGAPLYEVLAENSLPVAEDTYDLQKVEARRWDPVSRALRVDLEAARARVRLKTGRDVHLDLDYPVTLESVEATMHEGPRFVPITARVPVLEGVLATEHFTSREKVVIEGRGLAANGTGLDYDGLAERIELLKDTHVEIELEGGAKATLDADGGLVIVGATPAEPGATPESVEIVARSGARPAHLDLVGQRPLKIDADEIRLFGHIPPGADQRFVPTRAIALRNVKLVPEAGTFGVDGTFTSERATFEFTAEGLPVQATLEEEPVVDLLLRDASAARLPGEPNLPLGGLPGTITGAGPLTLHMGDEPEFDFGGPSTLAVPSLDIVLTADESLAGRRGGNVSIVTAVGNAVARRGDATVTCEEIELRAETGADGRTIGRLITKLPTHVTSPLTQGEAQLDAQGGLEYLYSSGLERMTEARDVDLVVVGPQAFRAHARTVRDFDPREGSFVALGDVTFEDAQGKGHAERADAYSRTHVELTGAPDAPARYELPGGEVRAFSIEYDGPRVTARGDVSAKLETEGRAHTFAGSWMVVTRTPLAPSETVPAGRERLDMSAGGAVRATVHEGDSELDLTADRVDAVGMLASGGEEVPSPGSKVEPLQLNAFGNVVFDYRSRGASGEVDVHGEGARLFVDGLGRGKLLPPLVSAAPGQEGQDKVRFSGTLPARGMTFDMLASEAEFSPDHVVAKDVDADILGVGVALSRDPQSDARAPLRAIAGELTADRTSVLLSDGAYLGQTAEGPSKWTLDAERILISGDPDASPLPGNEPGVDLPLHELLAWGGFRATLEGTISAVGMELRAQRATDTLEVKGAPASLSTEALTWTSEWFEWNVRTGFLESGQGHMRSAPGVPIPWELSYESLAPLAGTDSTVQVLREVKATSGDKQLYAAWALFWVDSRKWAGVSSRILSGEITPATVATPLEVNKRANNLFALLADSGVSEWLREAYLEGNIEVRTKRPPEAGEEAHWERSARADVAYIDLINGRSFVHDAVFGGSMDIGSRHLKVKVHAEWLRHRSDGTFEAERVMFTSCDFEDPDYEIEIGDLRMLPRQDEDEPVDPDRPVQTKGWDVSAKKTSVQIPGLGLRLPLPPVAFSLTDDFKVPSEEVRIFGMQPLSFGSDARFGAFVALSFVAPIGIVSVGLGKLIDKLMGNVPRPPKGDWHFRPTWLGSRGFGLNIAHVIESKGRYSIENELAVVNDSGDDRGLRRVPEEDRDTLRAWYRNRSRFMLEPDEWIDLVITAQSDPGVQAEFFESDFLEFEERETYVHWRKADGLDYFYSTAEIRLDNFRTEVLDQPSAGYYRAPGVVGELWGRPLNYTSNTEAARLLRKEGDPDYEDPFADGLGEREVLRVDTTHRIDRPAPVGFLGIEATPYLEARGTVWDEGVGPGSTPVRGALLGGLDLGTSFWRMLAGGLHIWSPSIGVRTDLVLEEDGQTPVAFDEVENSLDGTFVDYGVRSRWTKARTEEEQRRFLDFEVRQSYATSTDTVEEGFQPVRVNAAYLTEVLGVPAGISHDGRYDVQSSLTPYSRSYLGVRPVPEFSVETGYHSGRDPAGELLYNAISLGGRYTLSDKWEFEGEQTVSTTRDRLSSSIALRRFGHDYVFEVELSFVAGEGGNSLHFNFTPLFLYDKPSLGLLDRWSKEY